MLRVIGYLISTQGLNSLLGLVYWAAAARFLSLGDLGRAAATLSLIAFVASVGHLGIGIGLIRYRHQPNVDYPRLAGDAGVLAASVTIVLSAAVAFVVAMRPEMELPLPAWLIPPLAVVAVACSSLDSLSIADADGRGVLIRNGVAALGKLVLLVFLARDAGALVVTTMLALLVSAFVIWPRRRGLVRLSLTLPRLPRAFMRYTLNQSLVTWLFNLPQYLFPLLTLAVLGPSAAGYVAIAWGGALLLSSVGDAAGTALLSEGSRDRASLGGSQRRAVIVVGIALMLAVVGSVAAAPALALVYGPHFDENAVALFRLLVLASLPYLIVTTTLARLRALERSVASMVLASLSGLGACLSLVVLAPALGQLAPGWAYLIANFVASLVSIRLIGRLENHPRGEALRLVEAGSPGGAPVA